MNVPRSALRLAGALVVFCLTATSVAIPGTPASRQQLLQKRFDEAMAADSSADRASGDPGDRWANALDVVLPTPPDLQQLNGRAATLYVGSLDRYYAYYSSALEHRRALFAWQLLSSKITFAVVIFLVLAGVVFAGIQFFRPHEPETSTVDASLTGIKVSSPVLGVILLTLSLAFFYLYLVYVYPIHEAIVAPLH